jgi:hypothetical protein
MDDSLWFRKYFSKKIFGYITKGLREILGVPSVRREEVCYNIRKIASQGK